VRFGVLGPLEVTDDHGVRRDPRALRQRRLLLGLLVGRGELVSTDRIADIVWAEDAPRDPVRVLRTYVARLRAALEPGRVGGVAKLIVATDAGYRLDLDGHDLDVDEFERRLEQARSWGLDPAAALREIERALACWRGPALAEVADEPWAAPEAIRLEELRLTARELRFAWLLDVGRGSQAIGELHRHVREHPLREHPLRLLLVALARDGRTAEATQHFRAFRDALVEETGLDPSHELQRLHARLLDRELPPVEAPTAVAAHRRVRPADRPATRTSFVGRDEDVEAVLGLTEGAPLVTLTGIGGVGKSRLAVEVARRALGRFPDGAHLVALESLRDPELVSRRFAEALGLGSGGPLGTSERRSWDAELVSTLRDRRLLLIVDNAEHLLDPVAALIDRLLDGCDGLSVLATSREPLRVQGEQVWRVDPLATNAPDGSVPAALRLLLDRTTDRRPDLVVTREDRAALETICRRLDGIPLALELASGRLAHLAPVEVAARLGDHLRSSPAGPRRDPRHRTLHAAIAWSYDLLADHERALLRDLSVFAGACIPEAIEGVCRRPAGGAATVDVLGSLVAKSLVVAEGTRRGTRYRLLETVRDFGEEAATEAGEMATLRSRHRDWHLACLESFPWDHRIASPVAARIAERTHDDLRRALERSRDEPNPELLARQLRAMSALFCVRGHLDEGRRWHLLAAEAQLAPLDAAHLAVHRTLVEVWRSLGAGELYRPLAATLTAALELLPPTDPDAALALALLACCRTAIELAPQPMLTLAERSVELALDAGGPQLAGFAATLQCAAHLLRRDPGAAIAAIEHVISQPGWEDRHDGLRTRAHLAAARHLAGDHEGAIEDARSSLQQLGPAWQYDALGTIAMASAAAGDLPRAHTLLAELLDEREGAIARGPIQRFDLAIVAAAVAMSEDDLPRACRLLCTVRWSSNPTTAGVYLEYRRRLVARMGRSQRHAVMAASQGLDVQQVLAEEHARLVPHLPDEQDQTLGEHASAV
jgi:predicted ATPase/DNA-binding SARP family transcriptional activator